ncbi:MAG: hypothetical protein NTZ83_06710, partial [Candidatus Pacearchaeota archaeon]|nr:hypothetical protein [Candidatus Pacearchaeota archaeon]
NNSFKIHSASKFMEIWRPEKFSVTFFSDDGLQVNLAYNWSLDRPYSTFLYWGDKDSRECLWNFNAEKYGRDKIESYWKQVLKLNSDRELNLDSLYKTIERIFLSESPLRVV